MPGVNIFLVMYTEYLCILCGFNTIFVASGCIFCILHRKTLVLLYETYSGSVYTIFFVKERRSKTKGTHRAAGRITPVSGMLQQKESPVSGIPQRKKGHRRSLTGSMMSFYYLFRNYTSSRNTTSALSPWRGPSLRILVYPPFLPSYFGAISSKSLVTTLSSKIKARACLLA